MVEIEEGDFKDASSIKDKTQKKPAKRLMLSMISHMKVLMDNGLKPTVKKEEVGSTSTGPDPETKKQLAVKDQMMRKLYQFAFETKTSTSETSKLPTGHMEGLSVDDQMKISQDYNRMSPEEKLASNKKTLGTIKK